MKNNDLKIEFKTEIEIKVLIAGAKREGIWIGFVAANPQINSDSEKNWMLEVRIETCAYKLIARKRHERKFELHTLAKYVKKLGATVLAVKL
ncbi:MAG: hypothetical protein NTX38_12605 [Methylobacter sp.]|nr:hypothetical protein [Methylobacter sp.]